MAISELLSDSQNGMTLILQRRAKLRRNHGKISGSVFHIHLSSSLLVPAYTAEEVPTLMAGDVRFSRRI